MCQLTQLVSIHRPLVDFSTCLVLRLLRTTPKNMCVCVRDVLQQILVAKMMREEGIEPTTAGSGIQRSTTELFPHHMLHMLHYTQHPTVSHSNGNNHEIECYTTRHDTHHTRLHSHIGDEQHNAQLCIDVHMHTTHTLVRTRAVECIDILRLQL